MKTSISFNALELLSQRYKKLILKNISRIFDSGQFLQSKYVAALEKKLTVHFKAGYCTTVASGHDALFIALQSLQLQQGDEIIIPANAYPTYFPAALSGFTVIPADVDSNGQLDVLAVKKAITTNTKVVIIVHLYGLIGNLDEIVSLCKKNHITLIEDCAQAFGSMYNGNSVGTFGDIGCFSFYPSKNLGTAGDGGALWTKHRSLYDYFLKAKCYGEKTKYQSVFPAGHSRLPELQASILDIYLDHFPSYIKKKQTIENWFIKKIEAYDLQECVRLLTTHPKSQSLRHLFVVEVKQRDALKRFLEHYSIPSMIHYPTLVPSIQQNSNYPNAFHLSKNILSLPFHPFLTRTQIEYIVKHIKKFYTAR